MLVIVGHLVVGPKILAPKLIYLEAALVHVEMDVALLKIGGAGLPYLRLGMKRLHRLPRTVTDSFAVFLGHGKQDFQVIVICLAVDLQNHPAYLPAVCDNAIGFVLRIIEAALDGGGRDNITVIVIDLKDDE